MTCPINSEAAQECDDPLTARELRHLRSLRIPSWLLDELPRNQQQVYLKNKTSSGIFRRICSLVSGNDPLVVLEDKRLSRHPQNRKAIVAVGEYESFVYLPGVGIRWNVNGRMTKVSARRSLWICLWQTILLILQPTRELSVRFHRDLFLPLAFSIPYALKEGEEKHRAAILGPYGQKTRRHNNWSRSD